MLAGVTAVVKLGQNLEKRSSCKIKSSPSRIPGASMKCGQAAVQTGRAFNSAAPHPFGAAKGGEKLPCLRPMEARNANRIWRGRTGSQSYFCRGTAWESRGPGRQAVCWPRRRSTGQSFGGSGNRSKKSLRYECGQTLQMGAARQTPHSQKAECC
jgi:hypothetical protein